MGLTRTIAPTCEPITLEQAKAQVRNWHPAEEDTLNLIITAVREFVEAKTHRTFITSTFEYTIPHFAFCSKILLPRSPVIAVAADGIKYYDADNALQTLDPNGYSVITNEPRGYVWRNYGYSYWPNTYLRPDAVKITFTAGYGDTAESTPTCVKQAMLILVSHLWKNRDLFIQGSALNAVPKSVDSLLGPITLPEAR